jgi:hypothetical protein
MNNRKLRWTWIVVVGTSLVSACGSGVDSSVDAGQQAEASADDVDGACTGSLAEVRLGWSLDCPDTYSSAQTWASNCESFASLAAPLSRWVGSCNGFLSVVVGWGTHTKSCFYDPTTAVLVGAEADDDVPTYCNHTSSSILAGSYPKECPVTLLTDLGSC